MTLGAEALGLSDARRGGRLRRRLRISILGMPIRIRLQRELFEGEEEMVVVEGKEEREG